MYRAAASAKGDRKRLRAGTETQFQTCGLKTRRQSVKGSEECSDARLERHLEWLALTKHQQARLFGIARKPTLGPAGSPILPELLQTALPG